MTKLEEYTTRAAESLAAVADATNERDRAHHQRAHAVWRRLIANLVSLEERTAMAPEPKAAPRKAMAVPRLGK